MSAVCLKDRELLVKHLLNSLGDEIIFPDGVDDIADLPIDLVDVPKLLDRIEQGSLPCSWESITIKVAPASTENTGRNADKALGVLENLSKEDFGCLVFETSLTCVRDDLAGMADESFVLDVLRPHMGVSMRRAKYLKSLCRGGGMTAQQWLQDMRETGIDAFGGNMEEWTQWQLRHLAVAEASLVSHVARATQRSFEIPGMDGSVSCEGLAVRLNDMFAVLRALLSAVSIVRGQNVAVNAAALDEYVFLLRRVYANYVKPISVAIASPVDTPSKSSKMAPSQRPSDEFSACPFPINVHILSHLLEVLQSSESFDEDLQHETFVLIAAISPILGVPASLQALITTQAVLKSMDVNSVPSQANLQRLLDGLHGEDEQSADTLSAAWCTEVGLGLTQLALDKLAGLLSDFRRWATAQDAVVLQHVVQAYLDFEQRRLDSASETARSGVVKVVLDENGEPIEGAHDGCPASAIDSITKLAEASMAKQLVRLQRQWGNGVDPNGLLTLTGLCSACDDIEEEIKTLQALQSAFRVVWPKGTAACIEMIVGQWSRGVRSSLLGVEEVDTNLLQALSAIGRVEDLLEETDAFENTSFQMSGICEPLLDQWVGVKEASLSTFVERSLAADDFSPPTDGCLYSTSAVDVFSSITQTMGIAKHADFPGARRMMKQLLVSVDQAIQRYVTALIKAAWPRAEPPTSRPFGNSVKVPKRVKNIDPLWSEEQSAQLEAQDIPGLVVRLGCLRFAQDRICLLEEEVGEVFVRRGGYGGTRGAFDGSRQSVSGALQIMKGAIASKIIWFELRNSLAYRLWFPSVMQSRLEPILDGPFRLKLDQLMPIVPESFQQDIARDLFLALTGLIERCLLHSPSTRIFSKEDAAIVQADLQYCSTFMADLGLDSSDVQREMGYLFGVVRKIMTQDTNSLMEQFDVAPLSHPTMPMTKDNIMKVCMHRTDKISKKFVESIAKDKVKKEPGLNDVRKMCGR